MSIFSLWVGLLIVTMAVALVLVSYLAARKLLHPGYENDRTHDVATSVATRIAALHGLILALVYAQELDDYKGVRNVLTQEAVAISDVWNDAGRFGGLETVQQGLARYLTVVVGQEWDLLGERKGLSPVAWQEWDAAYEVVLNLNPETSQQEFLVGRMRDRMSAIAGYRQQREATSNRTFAVLFWIPALAGLALLAVPMYLYRPSRSHMMLIGLFGVYSGVIMFFIYAFSNPFEEPGRLEPTMFDHLLKGEIGQSLIGQ